MITLERLETILATLPKLNIALVGDLFLDRYLEIAPDVQEHSIETGLEAYQVTRVRNSPGALGTVMNNLAALGVGKLMPVSVIGDDGHGFDLRNALTSLPIDDRYLLADPDRLTPTYTKPLAPQADGARRELNRIDVRTRGPLAEPTCQQLCENLRQAFQAADGLIVMDQVHETDWGVVNHTVCQTLAELSQSDPKKLIFVDSRAHIGDFDFGILKGNHAELTTAVDTSDSESAQQAAAKLSQQTGRPVYCTRGPEGMLVARPDGSATEVPGFQVTDEIDIVGAGDSATSGIVTTLLAGGDEIEAATVGNLIASITVEQLGTTGTATQHQVLARWHEWKSQ